MKRVLLSITLVLSVLVFFACSGSGENEKKDSSKEMARLTEASFTVQGACGMCKGRIEKTANGLEGVSEAVWDKETEVVKFAYTSDVTVDDVHKAIAASGHDTDKLTAPDDVYNALPGCCHYRTVEKH